MAKKGISVGVEYTGSAKGFKSASEDAKKATDRLRENAARNSKKIENDFKQVTIAMAKITGAVILAKSAFNILTDAMKSTGVGGDKVVSWGEEVKAVLSSVQQNAMGVVTSLRQARLAAQELALNTDVNDTRVSDLQLRKASLEASIALLRAKRSEGKLTKEENEKLEKENDELYNVEQDIFRSRIEARVKFVRDSHMLDADLFNDLKEGIIARSKLNEDEYKKLGDVTARTQAKMKELRSSFTITKPSAVGMGVTSEFDAKGYSKALSEYIRSLKSVERIQVFEDLFSNANEWKQLIEYFTQSEQALKEHNSQAGLIARANVTVNKQEEQKAKSLNSQVSAVKELIKSYTDLHKILGAGLPGYEKKENNTLAPAPIMPTPDIETLNTLTNGIIEQQEAVSMLSNAFSQLYQKNGEGFQAMIDSFLSGINRMIAELAAKASLFLLLDFITGGKAGTFGSFMGVTKSLPKVDIGGVMGGKELVVNVKGVVKGKDLALVLDRHFREVESNT
jgi:hypothetical protein